MSDPLTVAWRPCGASPFGTVLRPIVPVELTAPATGRIVHTSALIDSGSDFTIGDIGLLDRLGVGWQDAECQFDVVNGGESLTYRHPVDLVVAETFTVRSPRCSSAAGICSRPVRTSRRWCSAPTISASS